MINKILVGEDNFVAQRVLEAMVEKKCTRLVIASSSQEILTAMQQEDFGLVLLDYHLDKDANVLIPEIRKMHTSAALLPIYILSAEPSAAIELKLKGIPFQGCIPKPLTTEELDRVLAMHDSTIQAPSKVGAPLPLINLDSLERTLGSALKVNRVVNVFASEVTAHLTRMEELLTTTNWAGLKEIVHRARAGYGYLGLHTLEQHLNDWEQLLERQENTLTYPGIFHTIKEQTLAVLTSIKNDIINTKHADSKHKQGEPFFAGKKILVVDDSQTVTSFLEMALTNAGALVAVAADGLEGISFARALQPDIIIMDINMPVLNGIDAIVELRQAGFNIPILAISNSTLHQEPTRALHAGATKFLLKPIEGDLLVETLTNLLQVAGPTG